MLVLGSSVLLKRNTMNCVNMTVAIKKETTTKDHVHILYYSILEMSDPNEVQNLTATECNNNDS